MTNWTLLGSIALLATTSVALAQTAAMTPAQAIAAAQASPDGAAATVEMTIGSTGAVGYQVYLNSTADYRDPANLTIELQPGARAKLKDRLGAEPQDVMNGKRVRVKGIAKRVAIPRRDGTTAYQTRIDVTVVDQITLIG